MKRKTTKLIALVISILMLMTLLPAVAPALALTASALEDDYGVAKNLELYPNWIGTDDQGLPTTMPIFDYSDYISETVWVEVPCDTDRDGVRDRVSVHIRRPNAAPGFKAPAVMEFSPYHEGTIGWSRTSSFANDADEHIRDMALTTRFHDNYPLTQIINPDTTHLTYEDIRYKGVNAWDPIWWASGVITTGSPYSNHCPAATAPSATVQAGSASPTYTTISRHQQYFVRGYAMLYCQLIGSRTSTGITNALHVEEWLSVAAVAQWLRGEAQAFTTRDGDVAVECTWSNGNVALDGTSYPGTTALLAAMSGVPGIKAIMTEANYFSLYDYFRAGGAINSPAGYGGEDMNVFASFNFSRFNSDAATGIPPAAGPNFGLAAQREYVTTQKHMMLVQDRVTGDYNAEWDARNLSRGVGHINSDVGILQTSGLMDWNVKPKHAFAQMQALRDNFDGNYKYVGGLTVHASQNSRLVPGKDGVERGMLKWYLMFMDHHLLGLDNKVDELMYDVNIPHNRTGVMEGYDYDVNAEERGTIIPGTTYQQIYLVPGDAGKAGRLSYNAPADTLESFADLDIHAQLESPTPQGTTALSDTNRTTIPLSTDGNYRVNGTQAEFCEDRLIGVSRTNTLAGLQLIDYIDRPVEGRLMYISEPLTERLLLSGTVTVHINAAPDRGTGNISAALLEIGRIARTDTGRTSLSVSTTGSTVVFPAAGGVGAVSATRYFNPVGSTFSNYKWVTWGHTEVQNPSYDGKAWYEVPEQNYIPNSYFQTTQIVPGEFYDYVIEMAPYNYVFEAGTRIAVMVYGTDPNYSPLLTPLCTAAFDVQLGEGSYVRIPLKLSEPKDTVVIEAGSDGALSHGSVTDIPYSIEDNIFGFNALELSLPLDSAIYTVVDVIPSALLGGADFEYRIENDALIVSVASGVNIAGNGELFTVTYEISASAPYVFNTPLDVEVISAAFGSFMDKLVDLDVSVTPGFLASDALAGPYTLTVNDSYAGTTGAGSYSADDTVSIDAGSRGNYIFGGWTVNSGGPLIGGFDADSATTTFTMPANAVTVTANWTFTGGVTDPVLPPVVVIPPDPPPLTVAPPLTDVDKDAWFYDDVVYVYEKGLMTGTGADTFSPYGNLTRGMIVTILYRMEGEPDVDGLANPFDDVAEGQYYTNAIKWGADNGIVKGYGNRRFGPSENVTREQLAAILLRYMNFKEINLPVTMQWIIFADEADIAGYAMDAIQTLNKLGVINGVGKNADGQVIIKPKGNATRAEAAAMLHRFLLLTEE